MTERVVVLKKLKAYSLRKKGGGKRFDYDGIRNKLIKLCNGGKLALDNASIEVVMHEFSNKTALIHGPQVNKCRDKMDSRSDTEVWLDEDSTPKYYTFIAVSQPAATE